VAAAVCSLAALATAIPPPAGTAGRQRALDELQGSAKLDALVDRVVSRQRSLRSLKASFVQVKRSSLLLGEVESSGQFSFLAPDRVRWDYRSPDPMVVLFADEEVITYHPQRKRARRIKVSKKERRFVRALAGTLPLDDVFTHFSVRMVDSGAPRPYTLELEPTLGSIRKRLDSLRLEVDRELLLPIVIEYNEADGDSTRYEFHQLEIDPELSLSTFRLELGDEVEVETIDAG
jgi:outer membrane lipoprotein-sorting protein